MNKILYLSGFVFLISSMSWAAEKALAPSDPLFVKIQSELEKKNTDVRVQIERAVLSATYFEKDPALRIQITEDNLANGANFLVLSGDDRTINSGSIQYRLWKKAAVAKKRILPGEKITTDMYAIEDVLVSQGLGRDFRGVMISDAQSLNSTEGRQTILEGQYIATTAVRRVPDIRKGEGVTIRLSAGEVVLVTPGTAEETSYLNSAVHVLANKSKRVLVGTLTEGHIVEVKL